MIIKDTKGKKLRLLKKAATLTEVTGEAVKGIKWYLNLRQLNTAEPGQYLIITQFDNAYSYIGVARFYPEIRTLGCRKFTKKTFALILKVAQGAK